MKGNVNKTQSDLKSQFTHFLTTHCKLSKSTENSFLSLNLILTNSYNPDEIKIESHFKDEKNQENIIKSNTSQEINESLKKILSIKESLLQLNDEVDLSFGKLNLILSSRDNLQTILKDFNLSTKGILTSKEKMKKLIEVIDEMYSHYSEAQSIQNYLDDENSVVKHRFLQDYDKIEKGISFFTLYTNYTESKKYLYTYSTLKIICINKYFQYISNSIENEANIPPDPSVKTEKFLVNLLTELPEPRRSKYYLFRNFTKMKEIIGFFEKKSKHDGEVKKNHDKLKQKYIDIRTSKTYDIYKEILNAIESNFNSEIDSFNHINENLYEIILNTFIEIVHYAMLFGKNLKEDVYLIKPLIDNIYSAVYNNIRPIIVSIVSLEHLIVLFDAFSRNFGIFFVEINEDAEVTEDIKKRIQDFWSFLFKEENKNLLSDEENLNIMIQFLIISKYLIRPTLLHLIQDIQEKIYFKISSHVKNNFIDIESDFPSFGLYEERLYEKYSHFSLFHFFLKRIVIVYEIFQDKLDEKILNQIVISSIETFISILNNEILTKNTFNYKFQIYIIQQILLCLEIVESFKIETVDTGIDLDFNFITEMFKSNYETIISGQFKVSDVLVNSAPKILDQTRDFKKILYNNLLKSYKILVNLANEYIYGAKLIEVYNKILNKKLEKKEIIKILVENKNNFSEQLEKKPENENQIIQELNDQILIIDSNIKEKISKVIKESLERITKVMKTFLESIEGEDREGVSNLAKYFS